MLRIPRSQLPENAHARHAFLRNYFCDRDARATSDGDWWQLDFFWPDDPDRHVDPKLSEHLATWSVGLGEMAQAVRRQGRMTTALYDTWTLVSWSRWFAAADISAGTPLTILHVDDHRDLMSPRLFQIEGGWRDPITNATFSVNNPASVLAALQSGSVGMGSFLTPVLHTFRCSEVRHLCQPPKASTTQCFQVAAGTVNDDLIEPSALRPAITLEPGPAFRGPQSYLLTPDIDEWLADLGEGPILLHIDMDYFNNRFDGDGDWKEREQSLDPDRTDVMARIRAVAKALSSHGLLPRVVDGVIAYSPGFFPSEFWSEADAVLRDSLGELYE
jgi:hypothetical protein